MTETMSMIVVAAFALAGLGIAVAAALKGWQGWLELRKLELSAPVRKERGEALDLIEMSDLKERIRKLEVIAACVDL